MHLREWKLQFHHAAIYEELKYLMSLSLVGNMTLCELCYHTARKAHMSHPPAIWDRNPSGLLGIQRNDQRTGKLEHNSKKKKEGLNPTVGIQWSSGKLFSISARWFSVLVYRIISSKCNHNGKPQCLVWTWGNLCLSPFSCQWKPLQNPPG